MDDALRTMRRAGIVIRAGIALAFITLPALSHGQGLLAILDPTISGDTVTLPIHVQGNLLDGVAALDFQLTYDAAILQPVQVYVGDAAANAGKKVQARVLQDGQYAVLMFGTERSAVVQGEVARIALNKISEPKDGQTPVTIINTTFATVSGVEIPSQGSTATLLFDSETDDGGGTPYPQGQSDPPPSNDGPNITPIADDSTKAGGASPFDLAGARAAANERLSMLRGAQAEREAARADIDRASGDTRRESGIKVRSAAAAPRANPGDALQIPIGAADRAARTSREGGSAPTTTLDAGTRSDAETLINPSGTEDPENREVAGQMEGDLSVTEAKTAAQSSVSGGVKAQAGVLAACLAIALGIFVNRRRRGA